MKYVEVTFSMESDDPDHEMGVSNETFDYVTDAIMAIGGDNIEFTKVDEDE